MMKNLRFSLVYFVLTLVLFGIEVLIATVWKDCFWVRSYLGDVLVVILLYTFVLSFFKVNKVKLIIGILIFSFGVEFLQYFKIADVLGLKKGSIPYIVVGNSFSWVDLGCYAIGCGLIYWVLKIKSLRG